MEIRKAKIQGFCFGVAITVKKAEEAIEVRNDVTTLGHVVHNPQMVEQLEKRGLRNAHSVDEVEDGTLFVRAHGLPVDEPRHSRPALREQLVLGFGETNPC